MTTKEKIEANTQALDSLLIYANGVTGQNDTNIGDAIKTLSDGFGSGGGGDFAMELISEKEFEIDYSSTAQGVAATVTLDDVSPFQNPDGNLEFFIFETVNKNGRTPDSFYANISFMMAQDGLNPSLYKGIVGTNCFWVDSNGTVKWSDSVNGAWSYQYQQNNKVVVYRAKCQTGSLERISGTYALRIYKFTHA